jgi:hypothetical protein
LQKERIPEMNYPRDIKDRTTTWDELHRLELRSNYFEASRGVCHSRTIIGSKLEIWKRKQNFVKFINTRGISEFGYAY